MSYNNLFTEERFPLSYQLLQKNYPNLSKLSMNIHRIDPFFQDDNNLINLFNWYKSKNPEFKPMKDVDPEMPEYELLVSGLIKDIYLLLKNNESNYKINNTSLKKPINILGMLEDIIKSNYKYIKIINCIYEYLKLFTNLLSKNNKDCNLLLILNELPYIIYPSFHQIDIYKVNLTLCAPFINFLISNKMHESHGSDQNPCYEIFHDISFHSRNLIIKIFEDIFITKYKLSSNKNCLDNIKFHQYIQENIDLFKLYFDFMDNNIQKLKDILIYKRSKNNSYNSVYKSDKKYMNSILIFFIFHEKYFYNSFFIDNLKHKIFSTIQNIKKIQISMINRRNINVFSYENINNIIIETIKKYFKNNFYKNCINFLLDNDLYKLKKYIVKNNNTELLKLINSEFKEIIENMFKIKVTNENINEIIELYKQSAIDIYNTLYHPLLNN
jgi:hypothetical protein